MLKKIILVNQASSSPKGGNVTIEGKEKARSIASKIKDDCLSPGDRVKVIAADVKVPRHTADLIVLKLGCEPFTGYRELNHDRIGPTKENEEFLFRIIEEVENSYDVLIVCCFFTLLDHFRNLIAMKHGLESDKMEYTKPAVARVIDVRTGKLEIIQP